jgi:hypothetical protein
MLPSMLEESEFLVLRMEECLRLLLPSAACPKPSAAGPEDAVLFCARALAVSQLAASVRDVISAIETSPSILEMLI